MRFSFSSTTWDESSRTYTMLVHPFWSSPEYFPKLEGLKRSWPEMVSIAKEAFALAVLQRVRETLPSLTLIFRDGNMDASIPSRLDLPRLNFPSDMAQGPKLIETRKSKAGTVPYLVTQPATAAIGAVAIGLVNEDSLATYLYCFGRQPIVSGPAKAALETATGWDDMLRSLVGIYELLAFPGPDAYYAELRSKGERTLRDVSSGS